MSLSSISSRRASKLTDVSQRQSTPVTSADLFHIRWGDAGEDLVRGGESGSHSVFLAPYYAPYGLVASHARHAWLATDISAPIARSLRVEFGATAITTRGLFQQGDPAVAFADMIVQLQSSLFVMHIKSGRDVRQVVSQIRDWADLTVSDVATLVGVSRRSLYHWLSSGRIAAENRDRVDEIAEALRPLAQSWRPGRLRFWLHANRSTPFRLLRSGRFAEFRRLADEAVKEPSIPVRSARRLAVSEPEPPEYAVKPLNAQQRRAFFDALLETRPAVAHEPWTPPEVTDSLPGEDE